MQILSGVVGLVLIAVILADGFQAMVLPRRVTWLWRPTRLFYRFAWIFWSAVARLFPAGKRRANCLSVFGPLSLLALFIIWVFGLVIGFAFLHEALTTPLNGPPGEGVGLFTYFYLSGTTFFTLGYGDVTAASTVGRLLTVIEAGMGFGFMAVIIGYLPVLYQAFSRREVGISLLDARAGSPPSAGQLLLRLARTGAGPAGATALLAEWERWAAELLESHLSFPVLSYYRSQHDNQSWLASLTAALDTCALLLAGAPAANLYQARLTFAMARHAAVDLAMVFRQRPRLAGPDRLPAESLARLRETLRDAGLSLQEGAAADARLTELRGLYEPFVHALAVFLLIDLPPVNPDREPVDNWQTSAWMRRAAGIGNLPAVDPRDDHAD
jgi:voltage-gated potassium channel Kch